MSKIQALIDAEREARARVFDAVAPGVEAPEEDVLAWGLARQEFVTALQTEPNENVQRILAAEVLSVESAMVRLEDVGGAAQPSSFHEALVLGERLRWILWLADSLSAELTVDPLALIEEELNHVSTQGRHLSRLDTRLVKEFEEVLRQSEKELLGLLRARLNRFLDVEPRGLSPGPLEKARLQWLAATEAFQIEADAVQAVDNPLSFFELAGENGL
ncbi:MAG: hypothetical protein AAF517_27570, partial [Planctomycetota bacterium]